MAKYGFLDALDDELARNFTYDYEINWDKKHHAVEIFYLLDVENPGVAVTDTADDEVLQTIFNNFVDKIIVDDETIEIHLFVSPSPRNLEFKKNFGHPHVTLCTEIRRRNF